MGDLHHAYEARLRSPKMGSSGFNSSQSQQYNFGGDFSGINTPIMSSPRTPTKKESYSDRFIPSRSASKYDMDFSFLAQESQGPTPNSPAPDGANKDDGGAGTYSMLLKSELLGENSENGENSPASSPQGKNILRFSSSPREWGRQDAAFSLSPVCADSQKLLASPRKAPRKVSKVPFKVLDAPALQDDFYLNLVDWSSLNVLAVGLSSCVYLWSACTSKVTKLCDLGPDDIVTSVSWSLKGTHLAVGTNSGDVQLWDVATCKRTRTLPGHSARVGTLSWNSNLLASGSRDRTIALRDMRAPDQFTSRLMGHKQEVCGLKWSFDGAQLASGGNDNKLYIWSAQSSTPIVKFHDHTAAVKAIAWSPHQHGILASGGGTADRCIRFWNTMTAAPLHYIDTGSQVCNLVWSKTINELVSTHGYSQNQIIVWKYPTMTKTATLTGHSLRVLYLSMSPDGQTIVTGAGDETLRFWNVFPGPKSKADSGSGASLLSPGRTHIR